MLDKTNQNVLIATEQKKSTLETVVRINHEYKNNESKNEQLLSQLKEIEKECKVEEKDNKDRIYRKECNKANNTENGLAK